MSTASNIRLIIVTAILFAVVSVLGFSQPAQAAPALQTDVPTNSCLTCHTDLYFLHDAGCLYCLTDHADRCVDCHEGNAATFKQEDAHLGLLSHPQENDGAKCKECHTADVAKERIAQFDHEIGFEQVMQSAVYVPAAQTELGAPQTAPVETLAQKLRWFSLFVTLGGVWVALVWFSPTKP